MELLGITIGSAIGAFLCLTFLYFIYRVSIDIPLAERHRFIIVFMVAVRNGMKLVWKNYGGFILGLATLATLIIVADILSSLR